MNEVNVSLYSLLIQEFIVKENIQRMKAGTTIFNEREQVNHIYILMQGSISLGRLHVRGKEFIMKILNGEEVLIEYQLFKANPLYHFCAKAITDVDVLVIKRELFEKFVQSNPRVLNALTTWLSTRYLKAQMKCQDLIMHGKRGGLYSILIRLCKSYGIMTPAGILIDLPLTHQELANLTYGTREVIQRMLKELREQQVISYEHQKFTVKNIAYLKQEVDCQHCPQEICGLN